MIFLSSLAQTNYMKGSIELSKEEELAKYYLIAEAFDINSDLKYNIRKVAGRFVKRYLIQMAKAIKTNLPSYVDMIKLGYVVCQQNRINVFKEKYGFDFREYTPNILDVKEMSYRDIKNVDIGVETNLMYNEEEFEELAKYVIIALSYKIKGQDAEGNLIRCNTKEDLRYNIKIVGEGNVAKRIRDLSSQIKNDTLLFESDIKKGFFICECNRIDVDKRRYSFYLTNFIPNIMDITEVSDEDTQDVIIDYI